MTTTTETMDRHYARFRWLFTVAAICDFIAVGIAIAGGEPVTLILSVIAGIAFFCMSIRGWVVYLRGR